MSAKKLARLAKEAQKILWALDEEKRTQAILSVAKKIQEKKDLIVEANQKDIKKAHEENFSDALIDRLTLNESRIQSMVEGVTSIAQSPKVVGAIISEHKREDGLLIQKERIPLGVIAMIFESRPNVIIDCSVLALKSGNAICLKGGKEAQESNRILAQIVKEAIKETIDPNVIQLLDSREDVTEILSLRGIIDVVIPRGGEQLIKYVYDNSKIPVIAHFKGLCHIYVHEDADLEKAREICLNAKLQRPGVRNAMETLLVHKSIAERFLSKLLPEFHQNKVELRACSQTVQIFSKAMEATLGDYYTEYLDKILSIKIVSSLEEAISHIEEHGTKHTEAIIANDSKAIEIFQKNVDASCLMVNASTRFNDGSELGLGAEIGISTTKIHAYGPMGSQEMTTARYIVKGEGHTRT